MNEWNYVINELPADSREVLVSCAEYPEVAIGYYDNKEGKWCVLLDGGEIDKGAKVVAWMDKPDMPPMIKCPFIFRTADEARYLTKVSNEAVKEMPEARSFLEVRTAIIEATTKGLNFCTVGISDMIPVVTDALINAGFEITTQNTTETAIIKW